MLVTIKGSKKEYRDLVRRAVWFYAEKLMGKRLVNTLELTINLTRNLTEKKVQRDFASGMNGRLQRLLEHLLLIWIAVSVLETF